MNLIDRLFNSRPVKWVYKQGDALCERTRCDNVLWLIYLIPASVHAVLSWSFGKPRYSWLPNHSMTVAWLVMSGLIFWKGRRDWRKNRAKKIRARLDAVNAGQSLKEACSGRIWFT